MHGSNGMWKFLFLPWFLRVCLILAGRDYLDLSTSFLWCLRMMTTEYSLMVYPYLLYGNICLQCDLHSNPITRVGQMPLFAFGLLGKIWFWWVSPFIGLYIGFFRLKSCMSISVKSCFIWTFAKKCRGDPIALLGLRSTTLHQMCLFWKGKDIFFQRALETPGGVGKLCKPWFYCWLGVIASQLDAETIYIPHNMYCSRWYPKLAGWPHDHSIIID